MGRIKVSLRGRARISVVAAVLALGALPLAGVTGLLASGPAGAAGVDSCGYPTSTVTPNGATTFNESGALASTTVGGVTKPAIKVVGTQADPKVAVWYTDEWALTLGVDTSTASLPADDVADGQQKTTPVTDPGVTTFNTTSHRATDPSIGDPELDAQSKPIAPSIFVTPVAAGTTNAAVPRANDWQAQTTTAGQFGVHSPNDVFGTWYHADEIGTNVPLANTANDPAANGIGWIGSGGSDPITLSHTDKYQAEIRWNATTAGGLNLAPGTYKVQIIIHDGDHAADTGEACAIVIIPGTPLPNTDSTGCLTSDCILHPHAHIQVPIGSSINDAIFIAPTPGLPAVTGKVTSHLYFVAPGVDPTTACVPANEISATSTPADAKFPSTETLTPGTPVSTALSSTHDTSLENQFGTYVWQTHYDPNGDPNYLPSDDLCGSETVTIVDAQLRLTPHEKTNLVGQTHDVTVTVESTTNGTTFSPVSGALVNFSLAPASTSAVFVPAPPNGNKCTTAAGTGQCTITINDNTPQTVTIHASSTNFSVTGVTGTFTRSTDSSSSCATGETCDAIKHYVDYRLRLTPHEKTNLVGNHHVITAHLEKTTDNTNWTGVSGKTVNFTINPAGNSAVFVPVPPNGNKCVTGASGTCTITINDLTAEDLTINGTTTFTDPILVGPNNPTGTVTRTTGTTDNAKCDAGDPSCGDAIKHYIKPTTTLSVTDQMVGLPGDATGSVTYTVFPDNTCTAGTGTAAGGGSITTPGTAPSSDLQTVADGDQAWFVATYTGSGAGNYGTFTSNCIEGAQSGP